MAKKKKKAASLSALITSTALRLRRNYAAQLKRLLVRSLRGVIAETECLSTDNVTAVYLERELRVLPEIISEAQRALRICKILRNRKVEDNSHEIPPIPSKKQLKDELTAVARDFPEVDFSKSDGITVTMPIVIADYDFGLFDVTLKDQPLSSIDGQFEMYATSREQRYKVDGFYHPHIGENGFVCLGSARPHFEDVWRMGRLYDLFLMVHALLQTYNPASPFVELTELVNAEEESCSVCGQFRNRCLLIECQVCNELVCSDCINYCEYYAYCANCETDLPAPRCYKLNCLGGHNCPAIKCDICGSAKTAEALLQCVGDATICLECAERLKRSDQKCDKCNACGTTVCPLYSSRTPLVSIFMYNNDPAQQARENRRIAAAKRREQKRHEISVTAR